VLAILHTCLEGLLLLNPTDEAYFKVNSMELPDMASYLGKKIPKASWGATIANILLAILIMIVVLFISYLYNATPGHQSFLLFGVVATILGAIITSIIFGWFIHKIATALGGKGTFLQLLYTLSISFLTISPLVIAFLVVFILSPWSLRSQVDLICAFVLGICLLGIYYLSIKVAYNLSSWKALLLMLGFVVLAVIIIVVLFIILLLYAMSRAPALDFS
jgi:hypothetical protein